MSNRSTECYHLDPQAKSLRVQVVPGHSLLLPFEELAFAELSGGESEETLTMHFDTHEVVLTGISLRRIEAALQRRELSSIAAIAQDSGEGVRDGQPVIAAIEVVAAPKSET